MEITCKIKTYPEFDNDREYILTCKSHMFPNKICLVINTKEYVVLGNELITAIQNCMNH